MPQVVKTTGFLKKNYYYLMGGFWFLAGMFFLYINNDIVFYMYFPLGLGMVIYGYLIRNKTEEFISWNNTGIIINDIASGKLSYMWRDIDVVIISNNHLTIKSGAAGGVILDLTGYKAEDVQTLEMECISSLSPSLNSSVVKNHLA